MTCRVIQNTKTKKQTKQQQHQNHKGEKTKSRVRKWIIPKLEVIAQWETAYLEYTEPQIQAAASLKQSNENNNERNSN